MNGQNVSPELPFDATINGGNTETPTLPGQPAEAGSTKPIRRTLNRLEAFAVIEKLKGLTHVASMPMEDLVTFIKEATNIETTPGIIRGMLKQLGVPHITFRSTPKPGAIDLESLVARIDGIDSRLEFVTQVTTEHVDKIKNAEASIHDHNTSLHNMASRIDPLVTRIETLEGIAKHLNEKLNLQAVGDAQRIAKLEADIENLDQATAPVIAHFNDL